MIYSRQLRFLFVHVSRTGGMSLRNFLYRQCRDLRSISPQHCSVLPAIELLGEEWPTFYKFAVVRNPWERLHSWYALMARHSKTAHTHAIADPDHPHWRGFDAFLETWLSIQRDHAGTSVSQLSQSAQLSDAHGNLAVDHIARFEHYREEISQLCRRLAWPENEFTHENAGPDRLHYRHYYTRFGAQLVAQTLADDLENFGYRFES